MQTLGILKFSVMANYIDRSKSICIIFDNVLISKINDWTKFLLHSFWNVLNCCTKARKGVNSVCAGSGEGGTPAGHRRTSRWSVLGSRSRTHLARIDSRAHARPAPRTPRPPSRETRCCQPIHLYYLLCTVVFGVDLSYYMIGKLICIS